MKLKAFIKEVRAILKSNPEAAIYFSQDEEGNGYLPEAELSYDASIKTAIVYPYGKYVDYDEIKPGG